MKNWLIYIFILLFFSAKAQDNYPKNDFRSPIDMPILLAGTFGEPRKTHFHAGLDIKTGGIEGKNIYAIGNGYISRIKVSAWGYGNVIYIKHTNGYTSVYAHLKNFNETITNWIELQQMAQTKFEIDLDSLNASLFKVEKGDIIGISGNTGGSQAPHLHFEIRDSLERPINPFLFGFDEKVKDNVKPGLYKLAIYNLTTGKQFSNTKTIKLNNTSAGKLELSETLKINKDTIGFGINTTDKFTGVNNHNGVYDIKMFFDGELMYHYQINRFSFDNARDVISHCDYWMKRKSNLSVHKCFVERGNKLNVYNYLSNNGYIFLYDYLVHNIKIEVTDFHKNKSVLNFKIQRDDNSEMFKEKELSFQEIMVQGRKNWYKNSNIEIAMPEDALYENMYFNVEQIRTTGLTETYKVGDYKIPLFSKFDIKMKTNDINEVFREKYLIAYKNYKGYTKALNGVLVGNVLSAESRAFGEYFIAVDTISPRIRTLSISEGKTMTKYTKFQFKMTDNLSGIDEYNCFINGNWVILELDGKKNLYTYTVDENILKGKNSILVIAKDKRNNASTFSANFLY